MYSRIYTRIRISGAEHCINIYDIRLTDKSPACGMNWPPEIGAMTEYLRRNDVLASLHVNTTMRPEAWVECNPNVGPAIHAHTRDTAAGATYLPGILERGVPVLLYAGDQDLVCPSLGLQRFVDHLTWHGAQGMQGAKPEPWTINHALVGTWQSARNLTFATLINASHMAPYDAPYAAHDMMLRFMDVRLPRVSKQTPSVQSNIGKDERVLVPHDAALLLQNTSAAPTSSSSMPSSLPAYASDLSGSLLVWILIGMAIALCVYMRRRVRHPIGTQYHAVGQHVMEDAAASLESATRRPPETQDAQWFSADHELDTFTLGDEHDEDKNLALR